MCMYCTWLCMDIYIYIYMCIYICIYMYISIYTHNYVYIQLSIGCGMCWRTSNGQGKRKQQMDGPGRIRARNHLLARLLQNAPGAWGGVQVKNHCVGLRPAPLAEAKVTQLATASFRDLSICLSVYLSICLSVYLSICLSVCLSVYLSIYPSIYLSI